MDVQTASAAPTAPLPVQTASALTVSTPTTQPAQPAQGTPPVKIPPAAPPAPTASHVDATAAKPAPVAMATQVTSESPSVRVATTSSVEYPPAALAPDEMRLTKEIDHLWHAHSQAQGSLRQSREEAAKIRADLSMHLYQLKSVLSRPGRGRSLALRQIDWPKRTRRRSQGQPEIAPLGHQKSMSQWKSSYVATSTAFGRS